MSKNTPKKPSKTTKSAVRHTAVPKTAPVASAPVATAPVAQVVAPQAAVVIPAPQATTAAASTKAPVSALPSAAVTSLIAQLQSSVAETSVEAADKLSNTVATGESRVLITSALSDVLANRDGYFHLVARAAAAMALGRLKDASSIDALTAATNDDQAEVSSEAILALGQMKAKSALPALHDIIANSGGFFLNVTRHAALRAVGQIGDPSSRAALQAVLDAGWEDAALVSAARESLAAIH